MAETVAAEGAGAATFADDLTWFSLKMLYREFIETNIFPPFLLPPLALNQYLEVPTLTLGWTVFNF